ncbi:penicillin-binding protein activator [Pseudohaliea rubra]|uniref:LppC putative lipoprotein n=1 Tax=Pseudohaliea rubra DSM 19751 TaxID=1265313 RepID=A0A095VP45_9GAMM|nr:penicillin-binding protein activator [Pseudohaliea rubra]KGE03247.1 LppC putative lipoprotein [Pseudohaliea rubra DSM 19751]
MTADIRPAARWLALATCLALAACGTQPTSRTPQPAPTPESGADRGLTPLPGSDKSPLADLFAPAMAALDRGDWLSAQLALPKAADGAPPDAEFEAWTALIAARTAYLRGDLEGLEEALGAAAWPTASRDLRRQRLALERRQALLNRDHLASARLADRALTLYPTEDPAHSALARALWRDLHFLDDEALAAAARNASPSFRGWLARLEVTRGERAEADWQRRYPDHPAAAIPLPAATAAPPRHIALLLPLSGRLAAAASAVRNGFLAAHFAEGSERPALSIIDTTRFPGAAAAYEAAVAEGAELVVGPLTKTAVAEVLAQPQLPVPVLALNHGSELTSEAGLQFALAPEDEAREIARRALGAGHRRALLLRPAGQWGDKVAAALGEAFTAGGGTIAASASFASRESHSDAIERALQLDQSAARGAAVRRLLDRATVLAGRRRQDLDVVFMLAPATETAKSLKPLIAYHYAGDLPAYATSAANSAEVTSGDRDLSGLQLVELPWFLGERADLRAAIADAGLRGAGLSRLQALGADAQQLALRYGELAPGGPLVLHGATGKLTVNSRGEIERGLPLATFGRGGLRSD